MGTPGLSCQPLSSHGRVPGAEGATAAARAHLLSSLSWLCCAAKREDALKAHWKTSPSLCHPVGGQAVAGTGCLATVSMRQKIIHWMNQPDSVADWMWEEEWLRYLWCGSWSRALEKQGRGRAGQGEAYRDTCEDPGATRSATPGPLKGRGRFEKAELTVSGALALSLHLLPAPPPASRGCAPVHGDSGHKLCPLRELPCAVALLELSRNGSGTLRPLFLLPKAGAMSVGWPGESRWEVGLAVEDGPALGAPAVGGLPDVVPEGTLFNMVLRRMHRPRSCSYQLLLEHQRPTRIQGLRWTPLTDSEESLDFSGSLEQTSNERLLRAGRQLHRHLLAACPNLIRDRKYHLRLYRQCCSGRELVDAILALRLGVHSRSQAVGVCQVLLDEGALCHVKHDWTFQDRDTQFYRFPGPEPEPAGAHEMEEELAEAVALLSQRGPDALLTVALRKLPGQRTDEELELIFEELLHIKAVAHLSSSVKRELAAVLLFESHSKAGTVLFSQGDKGTSWYIIWKGSVNVVTHGKGLVTTLHEGDDFGQLALVNDAPRAATIILREDNCHFLRVDKQDFNRIIKDVEAKTMRLEEHGKVVLVLERTSQSAGPSRPPPPGRNRYTVMSGTPEKILELLLEAQGPDYGAPDPTETFLSDFLLTYSVFMSSAQLCAALLHQYPWRPGRWGAHARCTSLDRPTFHAEPTGGSERERSAYVCNKRQQILRLVSQWVALYGPALHSDPVAAGFLEVPGGRLGWTGRWGTLLGASAVTLAPSQKLSDLASTDSRLSSQLREQWPERRRHHRLENGYGNASPQMKVSAPDRPPRLCLPQLRVCCGGAVLGIHRLPSLRGHGAQPPRAQPPLPDPPALLALRPFSSARNVPTWLSSQDEPLPSSTCAIRVGDKVPYNICRPDHSVLTVQLPVTATVREVMAALAQEDGWTKGQVLVKVNSAGDAVGLQPEARGVATSLGLNERLFVVNAQEVQALTPHPEQLGPTVGSAEGLDLVSAKDLAGQLTDHDWSLFNSIHQVELIHYVLGPQHLRDVTTANLERFMRRFNELQYWVATELCLCPEPGTRAQLLRKFIKLAAHLKEQRNLNSFFAIMFGLSNSAISRLGHTWERLPHKVRKLYSVLERLLDPSWNHRVYRMALTKLSPPVIPFMPLLLKDMTFIHEGNHTLVENLINFEKMRMMARAARTLHHCRSHSAVPLSPLRSRVSHLHEDGQAARISTCSEQSLGTRSPASTWAYVQQLKVIDNQRELSRLSRELES
ncbi:Rap guanine nucleotide exchange factor 3 [Galemys pyrenaicus]|uniref:Rap guanine nucleotide exchange factor 3 n=1 Tax=Galemys pyrenaicus TaxID=202257 RepID=A0A8J6A987_GALPY|nr:Rap guanine nucleotide exchange factor 3 [Galemys pyrenaicus]